MTFLPVVARELRVAARRRGTYWVRSGAALALIGIGTWLFVMMRFESPATLAEGLFGLLTGAAGLYCLLSGVRNTSDCLSQEKRDGTLGLLFLTDLKGYDIVLGKLVANSMNALYAVLAIVPMLAVPLLIGGVTPAEFWRMAAVALNTLFFSLAIGMLVSSLSRSARKAGSTTFLVLVTLTALFPALGSWLAYRGFDHRVESLFYVVSPGFSYAMAFDANYRGNGTQFWTSMGVVHGIAWAALALASFIAPRSWTDRPAGVQALRWRDRWKAWSYGNKAERAAFRKRLLHENAFFWLAARARLKPAAVWAVIGLVGAVWAWGLFKWRGEWLNEGMYATTAVILNVLIKGWFAAECGRQLVEDRQQGALELLLSTPLAIPDILRGQRLALQRQFLGPVLFVLGLEVVFLFATKSSVLSRGDRAFWDVFWVAIMLMLLADLVALYWVGLWQAISARNPGKASSAAIARILVLPWVLYAVVLLFVALVSINNHTSDPGWPFFLGLWFFLGLVTDVSFASLSRVNLLTRFREVAAHRFQAPAHFWEGLLRQGSDSGAPTTPASR